MTVLEGQIVDREHRDKNHMGLSIDVYSGEDSVSHTLLLKQSKYRITVRNDKPLSIYYYMLNYYHTKVLYNVIQPNGDSLIKLDIIFPREYKKIDGKALCPKCGLNDKTIPIEYGFGSNIVFPVVDISGDTTYTNFNDSIYYAGTCIHSDIDPNYYCIRDSVKF